MEEADLTFKENLCYNESLNIKKKNNKPYFDNRPFSYLINNYNDICSFEKKRLQMFYQFVYLNKERVTQILSESDEILVSKNLNIEPSNIRISELFYFCLLIEDYFDFNYFNVPDDKIKKLYNIFIENDKETTLRKMIAKIIVVFIDVYFEFESNIDDKTRNEYKEIKQK